MNFIDFVRAHGLIVRDIDVGRWVRVPTVDHPHSKNGAYKFMGDVGFVQNWAEQTEVVVWKPEKDYVIDPKVVLKAKTFDAELNRGRVQAAEKAIWIINQTLQARHDYLDSKGFKDGTGLVWYKDQRQTLVIPMRAGGNVVGCQLIDEEGNKKFLKGQRTNDATFTFGTGDPILCEGYATGLSIHAAVTALRARRSVVVCFSAGNLSRIAKALNGVVIVADNDASGTGEKVAQGYRFWMSDTTGEDFNDYHKRVGLFQAAQALRKFLNG
jgi:putative DNA primase/helicase